MLTTEQAEARLAEWRLPNDTNRFEVAVQRLPTASREAAEWLFDLARTQPPANAGVYAWRREQAYQATIDLDRMTAKQRRAVFEILSPSLATTIEGAWQLNKTTPYQCGYARRAFRAPRHPHLGVEKLTAWFMDLAELCRGFDAERITAAWLAAWAPHFKKNYKTYGQPIGVLLAALLSHDSKEADEVFQVLGDSLTNQHEIGGVGRHIFTAFLLSNRAAAWELVEKTLLAAQRQEGLRQSILESIDESHPAAFLRMLRLILDHDLTRFSATVRAIDVWFGQFWAAASTGVFNKILTQLIALLENPEALDKALRGDDAELAFLALWCAATQDAVASIPLAQKLLSAPSVELRFAAVVHLTALNLKGATIAAAPALDDDDLRVAMRALHHATVDEDQAANTAHDDDRFERIERLVERIPVKPIKLKPIVWPWTEMQVKQSQVAAWLLATRGKRPATRLLPHLDKLDPNGRSAAASQFVVVETWDGPTRAAIVDLAADSSPAVRQVALSELSKRAVDAESLTPEELSRFVSYLTRKTSDLRRGVLQLLLKQPDSSVLSVVNQLLDAKDLAATAGWIGIIAIVGGNQATRIRLPQSGRELSVQSKLDVRRRKVTLGGNPQEQRGSRQFD